MNESFRKTKLIHGKTVNQVDTKWWLNFTIGLIVTGPLFIIPFGRYFWRMSTGVPLWYR